jgi:hypothetical protein
MSKENGEQGAFATASPSARGSSSIYQEGLTKREYFASKVMQGLCSDPNMAIEDIPKVSVELADALLKELEKTQP